MSAEVERRLERLEQANARLCRENRGLRAMFTVVMLLGGAILLMGQAPQSQSQGAPQELVAARRFELVNKEGKMLALLGVTDDGAALSIMDRAGQLRGIFGVSQDNTTVFGLSDPTGKPRIKLNATAASAAINLLDPSGTNRVFLESNATITALNMLDNAGKVRALMSIDPSEATFSVRDPNGKMRAMMGAKTLDGAVGVIDSSGHPRILILGSDDEQKMLLLNAQGAPYWHAP